MSSFFGRLKSSNQASSASSQGPASPTKGRSNHAVLSPLEQILADVRPIRVDGSDKFFGMNNPSNTCYCNSVLQCLYFSHAFRQHVIDYPIRVATADQSSPSSGKPTLGLDTSITALPQFTGPDGSNPYHHTSNGYVAASYQTPRLQATSAPNPIAAASESKETFDNRKKAIMAAGPLIRLEHARFDQYGMSESLFTSLKDVFEAVVGNQSRMGVVVPTRFIEVLRENFTYFKEPVHHDAHEFLNLLLNDVVEQVEAHTKKTSGSINKSASEEGTSHEPVPASQAKASWVHELFEGTLTSETKCLTCENVSQRDEVFLDLSVDLEEHTSVTACLSRFSEEEMLCERNKFQCEKCCSLQEAEKRMKIRRLPKILALHLKRFKWFDNALRKLFDRVVFPFYLRIQNTTDDAQDQDRLYELYAVIVHLGSTPHHGHYVSIIKTKDRGWLLFDDELVLPVDASYVRRYFGGDPRNSACAYVLFYQETTQDAIVREQDSEDPFSKNAFTPNQREDAPASPAEEVGYPLESLPAVLKTPTTEIPLALKTHTEEDEDFLAQLENPTRDSQFFTRPSSAHLTRLSSEIPIVTGNDSFAEPNERHSLDKVVTTGANEHKSPDKPSDKPTSRHRILGTGSKSRFRTSSLSLKTKPKLWGKHERSDLNRDAGDHAVVEASAIENTHTKDAAEADTPQKGMKHKASRFALGRKRSGNLLQ